MFKIKLPHSDDSDNHDDDHRCRGNYGNLPEQ